MSHYILLQFPIPEVQEDLNLGFERAFQNWDTTLDIFGHGLHNVEKVKTRYPDAKIIAVKVNPFKRIALHYKHVVERGERWGRAQVDYSSFRTMDAFLEYYYSDMIPPIEGARLNQTDFYFSGGHEPDYLIEFDNFAEEIKQIPEFSNSDHTDFLQAKYQESLDYRNYYTNSAQNLVKEVYASDFERFGYTF